MVTKLNGLSILAIGALVFSGCTSGSGSSNGGSNGGGGGGSSKARVQMTAKALSNASAFSALKTKIEKDLLKGKVGASSISSPTGDEYEGMGVHQGRSVVESLKIYLTSVKINSGVPGTANASSTTLYDWSATPKEIDIAGIVNQEIEAGVAEVEPGTYLSMHLAYQAKYKIKAYSYVSSGADPNQVDTTIFTTAAGVVKQNSIIAPSSLASHGYAEYEYPFMYVSCSNSPTNSTSECGSTTVMPEPLTIEAPTTSDAGASAITNLTLFIDASSSALSWDGTGDGSASSDPLTDYGYRMSDFYPSDEPYFRMLYIPAFVMVNTENVTSHTYKIGASPINTVDSDNDFSYSTIIFDGNGKPVFGMSTEGASLSIGSVSRLFTETTTGVYKFYGDFRMTDANGVTDGGLWYNNDPDMAGFIIEGFSPLANVGDTLTLTVKDGPRCEGEGSHYDVCFPDRTHTIRRVR